MKTESIVETQVREFEEIIENLKNELTSLSDDGKSEELKPCRYETRVWKWDFVEKKLRSYLSLVRAEVVEAIIKWAKDELATRTPTPNAKTYEDGYNDGEIIMLTNLLAHLNSLKQ